MARTDLVQPEEIACFSSQASSYPTDSKSAEMTALARMPAPVVVASSLS